MLSKEKPTPVWIDVKTTPVWSLRWNRAVHDTIVQFQQQHNCFRLEELAKCLGGSPTTYSHLFSGKSLNVSDILIERFRAQGFDLWKEVPSDRLEKHLEGVQNSPDIAAALQLLMEKRGWQRSDLARALRKKWSDVHCLLTGRMKLITPYWIKQLRTLGVEIAPGIQLPEEIESSENKTASVQPSNGTTRPAPSNSPPVKPKTPPIEQLLTEHGGGPSPLGVPYALTPEAFAPHDFDYDEGLLHFTLRAVRAARAALNFAAQIRDPVTRKRIVDQLRPEVAELELTIRAWVDRNPGREVAFIQGQRLDLILRNSDTTEGKK